MHSEEQVSKKQRIDLKSSEMSDILDSKALNKFSRQNAALGADTTAKLIKMKVILVGLRGIGIETAKNLSLQGVGAITLIDPHLTELRDLGVNFFLSEDDVNKRNSRAAAVAPRIQELNSLCKISIAAEVTDTLLSQNTALIITEPRPISDLIELNESCRKYKISFLYSFTCGISTTIFVDHGLSHVVNDPTGEKPVQKLITDITKISETELLLRYDHPAGQMPEGVSGGHFEITDVLGLESLNHAVYEVRKEPSDPVKTIRITVPTTSILDSTPYLSGGLLTEKKLPRAHPMHTIAEKMKSPGSTWAEPASLVLTDLLNIGSELQQHVAFFGLLKYIEEKRRVLYSADVTTHASRLLPQVHNAEDAKLVVQYAKQLLAEGSIVIDDFELDEAFVER